MSLSLSFGLARDPSGEGSATQALRLHSALFSTSIRSTCKSSILYFTTSIHLFLHLPLLRCPRTSASKILLTQSSSSRHCTCPNHLNLASRTLSMVERSTCRLQQITEPFRKVKKTQPVFHLYSPEDATCLAQPTLYRLKIANFPTPSHLVPSFGLFPFEFMEKLYVFWNWSLPGSQWWKFGDPSLHHFWLIHPCDGRTDRQTDGQNCDG